MLSSSNTRILLKSGLTNGFVLRYLAISYRTPYVHSEGSLKSPPLQQRNPDLFQPPTRLKCKVCVPHYIPVSHSRSISAFHQSSILYPRPGSGFYLWWSTRNQQFSTRLPDEALVSMPLYLRAEENLDNTAIIDQHGSYTYRDLQYLGHRMGQRLLDCCGLASNGNLDSRRVAILCENDMSFVTAAWGIWMIGGVVVPLAKTHPPSELEYRIRDAQCSVVVAGSEFKSKVESIVTKYQIPCLELEPADYTERCVGGFDLWASPEDIYHTSREELLKRTRTGFYDSVPVIIIYTSGTTGNPKVGVTVY